jgi:CheY-like chemotaxis protein
MTTESTPPPTEMGQAPETAPVPSHGHRRRRRRRKNKSQQAGTPGQQPQAQAQPQAQPQAQVQPPPPPPTRPAPVQQNQQGQNQGHAGRKKKKFFTKQQQQPQPQPGNSINGGGQGKRRTRQKGPREFVGPMDHSYRAMNGNIADGPPSTIQMPGSHGGAYYPDAYSSQPAAPVREDAPTRIFCFIEDLFFLAKIQESARKLGVKVAFVKGTDKEAVARLTDAPDNERPALLVFDLNNLNAKSMTLIPKFKAKYKKGISIIGFLSHLQGDLKLKAIEAGCDTVMPRSAFSQSLPNLLRRYGVEEEEDYAPQPV